MSLRSGGSADYKIGVSRLWRGAKRMLASHLLMRFAAGEPFEAGAGWRILDFGMRTMAGMLAEPARPDRPQLAGADR